MKNIGIITPYGNNNFGNKLQNYALQENLKKLGLNPITLKNFSYSNSKKKYIIRKIKHILRGNPDSYRTNGFKEFNKHINFSKKIYTIYSNYSRFDYLIVGSDQVWNPYHGRLSDLELLSTIPSKKRISYAASFGIDELPKKDEKRVMKELSKFNMISVREDKGKEIINKLLPQKEVEVVCDPTMLLSKEEWKKIEKKPKNLKFKKYILNYFLGDLSAERKAAIEKIAKENDCDIINILDKNDPMYESGPSEFLYLEENAFLICTDSFHSSVFAIIFDRPFVVFDRQGSGKSMNSRLDTLISKFNLENRYFNNKEITQKNIDHNYSNAYKILKKEKEDAINFLKKALGMK